ncbi:hypothetical protein [Pantanalinema sp. GBBB05]|uniref:hypothetical protein n=1 Tax=Pantanalinema sp. GBBB05 TaxID=2604139 RepID=UPI001D22A5BA|nr:hypothetical protein [Pantanalinema sp. GBBB05]
MISFLRRLLHLSPLTLRPPEALTIWIVIQETKHGRVVHAHRTEEKAQETALQIAKEVIEDYGLPFEPLYLLEEFDWRDQLPLNAESDFEIVRITLDD